MLLRLLCCSNNDRCHAVVTIQMREITIDQTFQVDFTNTLHRIIRDHIRVARLSVIKRIPALNAHYQIFYAEKTVDYGREV